mmetsp:Transcript_100304/g.288140  ORF Transcript_100304/g.288140 Transcript_100304/m.288140 type:complete len:378 (+) Transcript_100304:364-1497(+)
MWSKSSSAPHSKTPVLSSFGTTFTFCIPAQCTGLRMLASTFLRTSLHRGGCRRSRPGRCATRPCCTPARPSGAGRWPGRSQLTSGSYSLWSDAVGFMRPHCASPPTISQMSSSISWSELAPDHHLDDRIPRLRTSILKLADTTRFDLHGPHGLQHGTRDVQRVAHVFCMVPKSFCLSTAHKLRGRHDRLIQHRRAVQATLLVTFTRHWFPRPLGHLLVPLLEVLLQAPAPDNVHTVQPRAHAWMLHLQSTSRPSVSHDLSRPSTTSELHHHFPRTHLDDVRSPAHMDCTSQPLRGVRTCLAEPNTSCARSFCWSMPSNSSDSRLNSLSCSCCSSWSGAPSRALRVRPPPGPSRAPGASRRTPAAHTRSQARQKTPPA